MNQAHLHLLLNHAPIIGQAGAICIILVAILRKNATVLRVGLWVLIVSAALGWGAYVTGEGAEEIVEEYEGVNHRMIHEHEEAAEFALWAGLIAGALAGWTLKKSLESDSVPRGWSWGTLIITLWAYSVMVRTGYLGGLIMHPEIRSEKTVEIAAPEGQH